MPTTDPAEPGRRTPARRWRHAVLTLLLAAVQPSPVEAQQRGGTLQWAMGAEPETLAPYLSVQPAAAQIGAKIYDGLLDYDAGRQPRPNLAERWTVAPDGRAITFHLRRDVVFHDGKPFTSADVRFSILEVLRRHHPRGIHIFRNVTAVATPDPLTAVVELSEPAPYLMTALAGHESPMLPRHLLGPMFAGPMFTREAAGPKEFSKIAPLVGTGPFKLAARDAGRSVRLVRNDRYWRGGTPLLDAIEVRFEPGEAARAALAESNDAHVVSGLDTPTAKRLAAGGDWHVRLDGADALAPMAALSLNTTRPPLDKVEVRLAVALAIDRPALIASVWHGFARPATGPLPAFALAGFVEKSVTPIGAAHPDPVDRANRLLDAAGLMRRDDGVRMSLVHDVAPLGPEWQRLSEGIELQLARVGIKIASRYETLEAWVARLSQSGDFALASLPVHGLSDPVLGVHRTLHGAASLTPSPFTNSARWRHPQADALMDQAAVDLDPVSRGRGYRDLQDLAVREAPLVWLAELTPPVLVRTDAHAVMVAPHGLYGNFSQAWIGPVPATADVARAGR